MTTDLNQLAAPQKRQLLAELLRKELLQPKDRPLSIGQERLHWLAALYADVPLGRLTLFMLTERNGMSDSLFDPALGVISPSLGWESVAAGAVERYELSGGHLDILKEPFVRGIGRALEAVSRSRAVGKCRVHLNTPGEASVMRRVVITGAGRGDATRLLHFKTDLSITEISRRARSRMAALLQSRDNLLTRSRLVPIQPNGTKALLFLCGDVGMYYSLTPYLGNDQPIYGLMTEIVGYPRVEDVARHYVSFVRDTQVKGPYYLGGWSFGGLVAFEIAQRLRAMGEKVALIALMDSPGPAAYRLKTPVRRALGHGSNLLRYGYPYLRAKIENQLRRLKRKRSNHAGRAQGNGTRYERKPYAGRLTLFVAQGNGISDTMFDPALGIISPSLGWESVAAGGVERYELLGGHVDILREPFVRALGERLRQCLDREQLASAGCI